MPTRIPSSLARSLATFIGTLLLPLVAESTLCSSYLHHFPKSISHKWTVDIEALSCWLMWLTLTALTPRVVVLQGSSASLTSHSLSLLYHRLP
jgi:hypothetical protein